MTDGSRALVQQLDEIVWAVDPENDTVDGLATYISQFVNEFFTDSTVRCRMKAPASLPNLRLNTDVRHSLFLAVREALNNVARHSGATDAQVVFLADSRELRICITDNGRGFEVDRNVTGHGLANLKQRLEAIGGRCIIESAASKGTTIELSCPWPAESESAKTDPREQSLKVSDSAKP
jgi:signal transduction histidine kinase